MKYSRAYIFYFAKMFYNIGNILTKSSNKIKYDLLDL